MGKNSDKDISVSDKLRKRAEDKLSSSPLGNQALSTFSPEDIETMLHDFSIHQIELEMQNDELRKTQADLENIQKKYTHLYEFSPVGYVTTSEKGIITEANLTFTSMLKTQRNQIIGEPFSMFMIGEDLSLYYQSRNNLLKTDTADSIIVRIGINQADWFYASLEFMAIPPGDQNALQIRIAIVDVHKRITYEKELNKKQQAWTNTFNSISDWVSIIDVKSGTITQSNIAGEQLLQCKMNEIIGQPCWNLMHNTEGPISNCPLRRMLQTGEPEHFEYKTSDGRWYSVRVDPIKDEQNKIYNAVHIVRDITERKKLEDQLRQTQKMDSIGNLAGGIAHDFNNLLFPIIGMSEMLLEDLPQNSLERENAQEIFNAGIRAGDLVKQILAFSRQSEQKKGPVRIQNVLKEVLKLCRSTIPTNIEICEDIDWQCGLIMADDTQMHQVIMNLMTNAFHATEEKNGRIAVTLKKIELEKGDIPGCLLDSGQYIKLSVTDNGTGMPQRTQYKIFDPYFTTKQTGKGTGLGLAVVHGIIKEHNGEIKVYSEEGEGSTFNVYLPLMKSTAIPTLGNQSLKLPTGTEKILLVDDEKSVAMLEGQMLSRLNYQVTTLTDSFEALREFKTNPAKFDLVISDMTMPNMTGDQLAREILSLKPDIPIIICTGFSERINEEKAQLIGVKGFLMKPVVMYDLAKLVRDVLDEANNS